MGGYDLGDSLTIAFSALGRAVWDETASYAAFTVG